MTENSKIGRDDEKNALPRPVQVTVQMREARDAARTLLGDRYAAKLREYVPLLQAVASAQGVDVLEAAQTIVQEAGLNGVAALYVLAAAVELVSPSEGAA